MTTPSATLFNRDDKPYAVFDDSMPFIDEGCMKVQLMQVDIEAAKYVIRTLFSPGTTVQKHKHTGEIYAFTYSGSWYYKEYPGDINVNGSYLYEPAGSTHTIHVPHSNTEDTEICFVMNGANLNLDADGNVESVLDAEVVLELYTSMTGG